MTYGYSQTVALTSDQITAEISREISSFLDHQTRILEGIADDLLPVGEAIKDFLEGGKRLRPRFAITAYQACGGTDIGTAIKAVTSLEFLHACALIHDDVMDGSETRRGKPAVHHQFANFHRQEQFHGNSESFGLSSAILLGDLCLVWADQSLHSAGLTTEQILHVQPIYDEMRAELMAGQYLDVLEQAIGASNLERSLRVARYKSGKYSVERPLHFGSAMAKSDSETLRVFSDFGLPLGEAFQLRDDILGVFGDPTITGKPAGDDLREGKRTVLMAETFARASQIQTQSILRHFGDPHLSSEGISVLREIISSTGALAAVEKRIETNAGKAQEVISSSRLTVDGKSLLSELAVAATVRNV